MARSSVTWRRVGVAAGLWTLLYLGVSVTLFALFELTGAAPRERVSLAGLAFSLGVVVTGLAFVAVLVDRLVFSRRPEDLLTRQSVWVMVLVVLSVGGTGAALATVTAAPGDAVLLGIGVAVPTTMLLFAAVNLVRYRTMEHGAEEPKGGV